MEEKLLKALKSLVSDIESCQSEMYPYWFGPFEETKEDIDLGTEIEWPNLAISCEEAKKLIAEAEKVIIIDHQEAIGAENG